MLKVHVQLPEVPNQLTEARPDIIFKYYCMILFNSIFCSVSMSNIWSVTSGLSKTFAILFLTPQSTQSAKLISAVERRKFLTGK